MFHTVNEDVAVVGIYAGTKFTPVKFRWNERSYQVDEITITADSRDGGVRKRTYSILSKGNLYRICFNRETEEWTLKEIWAEG